MTSSNNANLSAQPTLFPLPVEARWCVPANLGTADCGQICHCDDGCAYVIKDGKSGGSVPLTPHSEWFCTQLADLLGIASPQCKIIKMDDSSFTFGSRWEGGVVRPCPGGNWWDKVKAGDIKIADIKGVLSRIYAFDHFIHNPDRHANNFLVRDQHAGYAVLAYDYSRAWMCTSFPNPRLSMNSNTVIAQRWLSNFWSVKYIDKSESNIILNKIRKTTKYSVERIIDGHPKDWLTQKSKEDILNWWGSPPMFDRLDGISKGIENGKYL
jgi:hypothetical protein